MVPNGDIVASSREAPDTTCCSVSISSVSDIAFIIRDETKTSKRPQEEQSANAAFEIILRGFLAYRAMNEH